MQFIKSVFKIFKSPGSDTLETKETGFGTFFGVFVPNVTMMFGVIMFLRLGLVVGNVGIGQFAAILALSLTVMVVTSLSIAMIVTNMKVGGGGVYYLLSRSLGIEVGGAIGIALALAQAISVSVCTTGFAYSLHGLLLDYSIDVHIVAIEVITLAVLAILSFASANLALQIQLVIYVVLIVGIGSVFFSNPFPSQGYSGSEPYFPRELSFWEAFSLFYPALTGIEAGMGLSGNLKNPSRSLWLGSLLSLLFVAGGYFLIGLYLSLNIPSHTLVRSPMILLDISRVPSLVYVGIWGATLSSSLGALIGGPRMFQSIAEDGVVPEIFSRTYGKYNEPRYALALTSLISLFLMVFTTIDQIIPILAMICLISYGTLNIVAGLAELIQSPRWRPTVRIPWWISLMGGGLCLFLMFMINAGWTFITICLVGGIYIILRMLSLEAGFQDFRENIIFFFSRLGIYYLSQIEETAHHWHPQILVFSNSPMAHRNMICLASSITRRSGILTVATIVPESWQEEEYHLGNKKKVIVDYIRDKLGVSCLVETQTYPDPLEGMENLIKSYGLGQLQPNTIMMNLSKEDDLSNAYKIIEVSKLYSKNVIFFRDSDNAPAKLFKMPYYHRKRIDIWWDYEYSGSFELILSLTHALTSGLVWSHANVRLRAVVADPATKEHIQNYFDSFIGRSRVRLKYNLYVDEQAGDYAEMIKGYSKDTDLIILPLRPIEECKEEYIAYLQSLIDTLPEEVPCALVTCYDSLDHREIYSDAD